jgi:hypothetical protein
MIMITPLPAFYVFIVRRVIRTAQLADEKEIARLTGLFIASIRVAKYGLFVYTCYNIAALANKKTRCTY